MRKLKNRISQKIIFLSLILILAISLGYAILSTALTINGTANISSNSWLVYFTNVDVTPGSVTATNTPTTSGTSTTTLTWEVNLETPGDFYEYYVDVKNDGTIDAMIGSLSNTSLSTNQAKYLAYSVTYDDGATIEQYDKLASGDMVTLKVRVEYKTDLNPEDLPSDSSSISLIYTSNYVQADGNAKPRNINGTPIGYAVQIYGIGQDVDENDNPLGLTFGPALGDNYSNKYVTHRYEETSTGSGLYNVIIVTHTVDSNGDETIQESTLIDSASQNVTRTEVEKNKYDVNMHEMTWEQIAAVGDKTIFTDCMLCGDTKRVGLTLNNTIGTGTTLTQYGDGTGALHDTIKQYYLLWNPSYNSVNYPEFNNSAAINGGNAGANAKSGGGYSSSHIRATLIGENSKTDETYAGNLNLTTNTCLYSCIDRRLRNVITAKKIKYYTDEGGTNILNTDITDKIWCFSSRELFTWGEELEGIGTDPGGYEKFVNDESRFYFPIPNNDATIKRTNYIENSLGSQWWSRTPNNYTTFIVDCLHSDGSFGADYAFDAIDGSLAFGFCIQ